MAIRGCPVFPTPVGVFLLFDWKKVSVDSLPHARGGVSRSTVSSAMAFLSSPRPWGCFCAAGVGRLGVVVFPTPVGVFLERRGVFRAVRGLPHARGGVSKPDGQQLTVTSSSPRPWGCFRRDTGDTPHNGVFPTPVGVFLAHLEKELKNASLPHARGGVSVLRCSAVRLMASSPRPWGCFLRAMCQESRMVVFPTPVGVFLEG